jgi:hypothetical protein
MGLICFWRRRPGAQRPVTCCAKAAWSRPTELLTPAVEALQDPGPVAAAKPGNRLGLLRGGQVRRYCPRLHGVWPVSREMLPRLGAPTLKPSPNCSGWPARELLSKGSGLRKLSGLAGIRTMCINSPGVLLQNLVLRARARGRGRPCESVQANGVLHGGKPGQPAGSRWRRHSCAVSGQGFRERWQSPGRFRDAWTGCGGVRQSGCVF